VTNPAAPTARTPHGDEARSPGADRELVDSIAGMLELVRGKWNVQILFLLARGASRHSRLVGALPEASKKVISSTLRGLERNGLVTRTVLEDSPPRVEYALTALGRSATEPLMALAEWHGLHRADLHEARRRASRPSA
jgi:DNA-binding HxlR family transcriptional regulator